MRVRAAVVIFPIQQYLIHDLDSVDVDNTGGTYRLFYFAMAIALEGQLIFHCGAMRISD